MNPHRGRAPRGGADKWGWGALGQLPREPLAGLCCGAGVSCASKPLGIARKEEILGLNYKMHGGRGGCALCGFRAEPQKPGQTRGGVDACFHFYSPQPWTSPRISLFLPSLGQHKLQLVCTQAALFLQPSPISRALRALCMAVRCPRAAQGQPQPGAQPKCPALRVILMACSEADIPAEPRGNPRMCHCASTQVLLCSTSSSQPRSRQPTRTAPLGRPRAGRLGRHQRRASQQAQPAAEHEREKPLSWLAASPRAAGSCFCVAAGTSASLSAMCPADAGSVARPRRAPRPSPGRLEGRECVRRESRNVLPGEPPCASSLILYSWKQHLEPRGHRHPPRPGMPQSPGSWEPAPHAAALCLACLQALLPAPLQGSLRGHPSTAPAGTWPPPPAPHHRAH